MHLSQSRLGDLLTSHAATVNNSPCQDQCLHPCRAPESPESPGPSRLPQKSRGGGDLSPFGLQSRTKKAEGKKQGPSSPVQCERSCPWGHQLCRQCQRDLGSNLAPTPAVSLEPDCLKVPASVSSRGNQRHFEFVGSIMEDDWETPDM